LAAYGLGGARKAVGEVVEVLGHSRWSPERKRPAIAGGPRERVLGPALFGCGGKRVGGLGRRVGLGFGFCVSVGFSLSRRSLVGFGYVFASIAALRGVAGRLRIEVGGALAACRT